MQHDQLQLLASAMRRHFETEPPDTWILLPGIGSLCIKEYVPAGAAPGSVQRKPFFMAAGSLIDQVAGVAPRANDDLPGTTPPGCAEVCAWAREELLRGRVVELVGVGSLGVRPGTNRPSVKTVVFRRQA